MTSNQPKPEPKPITKPVWEEVLLGLTRKPRAIFEQVWDKVNHLARTNFDLGCDLLNRGLINDALFRFKIATWLEPKHYIAWYNLGCCYLSKGKMAEAAKALKKALDAKPDYEEARFMLASVDPRLIGSAQPVAMPKSLLVQQFNEVAPGYDDWQLRELNYKGHQLLHAAAMAQFPRETKDLDILELGTGTGLAGPLLRAQASRLRGVDIVPAMVDSAKALRTADGSPIYDEIVTADLRTYLAGVAPDSLDVIFASNTLNYLGDLGVVFEHASRALKQGGILAFSTDQATVNSPFHVIPMLARFGHHPNYIRELAGKNRLEVISLEQAPVYPQQLMLQAVLRKH